MRCELKDHDADHLVILPIHKPDGSLITIACRKHARDSGYFCLTHDLPHTGFDDGGHACLRCIESTVHKMQEYSDLYLRRLEAELSTSEFERLREWADFTSELTGDTEALCILRAVVTTAARLHPRNRMPSLEVVADETMAVLEETKRTKSAETILPSAVWMT
ncbi:MAG: hypothetical protein HYW37_01450 [Candidatus Colwellbacteria bacterium]|nr:hypothetical protein [Candidatus Colwellbacteria bacterium]